MPLIPAETSGSFLSSRTARATCLRGEKKVPGQEIEEYNIPREGVAKVRSLISKLGVTGGGGCELIQDS